MHDKADSVRPVAEHGADGLTWPGSHAIWGLPGTPGRAPLTTVAVILPSLFKRFTHPAKSGRYFLEQAVASIRAQTVANRVTFNIIVGIDEGAQVPDGLAEKLGIRFVHSNARTVTAALNAAARQSEGDYVGFLEDDDQWHPQFLETALSVLSEAEFVSSTQLEVTEQDEVVRIVDFPTASGWIMRRSTWRTVGEFNEGYKLHHDNEWLGRLGDLKLKRAHLVEATAPVIPEIVVPVRPWLSALLTYGGPCVRLVRHGSPWPLILRLVHASSAMQQIDNNASFNAQSQYEHALLQKTFGRVPW
ncbi:MAG: hypothetical protein QOI12_3140 [Alphaproteobacteria bacterium]|nr:hypothetical protein [Alphaproteobacteria bacterium]